MAAVITTVSGSEISPVYVDFNLFSGSDQVVRMFIRPQIVGGILGQNFVLTLRKAYDDPLPALMVTGVNSATIDPTGALCVVDFAISLALAAGLFGRYIASIRRTDSGSGSPLAIGQARVIES